MNCAPYSCFSEKLSLSPSSVEFLPKSFQRISQMPNTFHLYLSISYTNCSRFPASHSSNINVVSGTDVISLDISSILIISPWWLTDIVVRVPGDDRAGMFGLIAVYHVVCLGQMKLDLLTKPDHSLKLGSWPWSRTRSCWFHHRKPPLWPVT